MLVYRGIKYKELKSYLDGIKYEPTYAVSGINTFSYNKEVEYIHFYLFPYCSLYYAKRSPYTKAIMTYNIEDKHVEKYYGYGYYGNIIQGKYIPIPEIALPINLFSINNIKTIEDIDTFNSNNKDKYIDKYLYNLDKDYCADYYLGFPKEKDIYSVLEIPKEKVLNLRK